MTRASKFVFVCLFICFCTETTDMSVEKMQNYFVFLREAKLSKIRQHYG